MSEQSVVISGVVHADGTLELANKVPLPAGRVTVTVQPVSNEQKAKELQATLERIRTAREAAGLVPRTRDQVDAHIEELRNEFDEGVAAARRLHDEAGTFDERETS